MLIYLGVDLLYGRFTLDGCGGPPQNDLNNRIQIRPITNTYRHHSNKLFRKLNSFLTHFFPSTTSSWTSSFVMRLVVIKVPRWPLIRVRVFYLAPIGRVSSRRWKIAAGDRFQLIDCNRGTDKRPPGVKSLRRHLRPLTTQKIVTALRKRFPPFSHFLRKSST